MALIDDIITSLLLSYEHSFYGFMLLRINKVLDEIPPPGKTTATLFVTASNGKFELHYSEKYLKQWSLAQQIGLIEHELLHLCNSHYKRFENAGDKRAANIACDCAINQHISFLPPDGITLKSFTALLDEQKFSGVVEKKETAEYYLDLLTRYEKKTKGEQPGAGCYTLSLTRSMGVVEELELENLIKQCIKEAGSVPNCIEKIVSDLSKKAALNWKQILLLKCSRTIKQGLRNSWKRLRRRSEVEYKGKVPDYRPKVVVAVDTSGSIFGSPDLLEEFTQQILKIQEIYKNEFDVIECDASIQKQYKLSRGTKLSGRYQGGGGTDFRPVFDICNKKLKPGVLVYLTDGFGEFPPKQPKYPVIWAVTRDGAPNFPFGEKILICP